MTSHELIAVGMIRCDVVMTSKLNDAAFRQDVSADRYVGGGKPSSPTHVNDQTTPPPPASHGDRYVNGIDDGVPAEACMDGGGGGGFCAADAGAPADGPRTDEEGYRVEHRFETESVSRSKEVRDLTDESTELRLRETKEVTLEELKSRDGETRPATSEELRALLEAQWDGCDEVEISREIVVEEFNRVESQHEEVRTVVVTYFHLFDSVHMPPCADCDTRAPCLLGLAFVQLAVFPGLLHVRHGL